MKVIILGATGMVGEGVLLECLANQRVQQVLVINRRPGGRSHQKLREIVHENFFDLDAIADQLQGYDACFFCLGVSSLRKSPNDYKRLTYDLTLDFAHALVQGSPEATFCYVTGAGTDSTEKGRARWARVKGATENALLSLLASSYVFRPGFLKASPEQRNVSKYYRYLNWFYPLGRHLLPSAFCTLEEVGRAMIYVATFRPAKRILEVKDIVQFAAS